MVSQSPQVMDLTSLRAVLADLRARLLPSRFEKAQQPDPQTLQLGFRTLARNDLVGTELESRSSPVG
jgi:predicted ribosome quality control (RQC) complex YloA/Tae2 family protein